MKATDAYIEYCALKAHFEQKKYDYHHYNGKIRAGNYEQRKDKHFFFRLSRAYNKKQLQEYYIANFMSGEKWVGNMTKENWLEWKKKIVRLQEIFDKDLLTVKELLDEKDLVLKDVFKCESGQHPIIFRLLLGGYIQIETFTIIHIMTNLVGRFNKLLSDDVVWNDYSLRIKKYSPFLRLYLTDAMIAQMMQNLMSLNTVDN